MALTNAAILTMAVLLTGCGSAPVPVDVQTSAAPAAMGSETITGKVIFEGSVPAARSISMDATPACARQHSTPQKSQEVVVNANGTLQHVLVYVKSNVPAGRFEAPKSPVVLEQKGCIYEPAVLAVMTNQQVRIINNDPTNHNIHPQPKINAEWNESQAPGSGDRIKTFTRHELSIPIKCNIHPWMRSTLHVLSHPFYAVTSTDGTFTIKGLPSGEYTVEAVHEKLGTQEIKVQSGKTADFTFKR